MDNKKQIEVRLANCKPIPFMINEDEEEIAIKAQEDVTHIWKVWRERYSKEKSSFEVMAMVAFQYARLYYTKDALARDKDKIDSFAKREGLDAHAKSITIRFEQE